VGLDEQSNALDAASKAVMHGAGRECWRPKAPRARGLDEGLTHRAELEGPSTPAFAKIVRLAGEIAAGLRMTDAFGTAASAARACCGSRCKWEELRGRDTRAGGASLLALSRRAPPPGLPRHELRRAKVSQAHAPSSCARATHAARMPPSKKPPLSLSHRLPATRLLPARALTAAILLMCVFRWALRKGLSC
jgi:hypothetical protein